MKLLLDTQAFLWYVLADPRLSQRGLILMNDPGNKLFLSPASFWELAIKISLGKYQLTRPFDEFMNDHLTRNQIDLLPITVEHVAAIIALPHHHRDPFDRLLVAQALTESFSIVSSDPVFDQYGTQRHW